MRTLRVEFTEHEVVFLDGNMAGNKGEHLATQLIITLPDEMTNSMLDYYIVSFRNYQDQKIYCSQAISEGGFDENYYLSNNKIYIKIPAEATASSGCFVVVEGYKAIDEVIVTTIKAPCFKLEFKDSIGNGARDNLKNLPSPLTVAQRGITVTSANITEDHHLMIGLSDHSSLDAGVVSHTDNNYTDEDKFIVNSLETGAQVNRIEKISLNGENISISDKTVDINLVKTDNNYTNQEKSKLSSIEDNAQENKIETLTVNGITVPISNKHADITITADTTSRELTQSEYDALTEEEKNSGTIFFITDGTYNDWKVGADGWVNLPNISVSPISDDNTITTSVDCRPFLMNGMSLRLKQAGVLKYYKIEKVNENSINLTPYVGSNLTTAPISGMAYSTAFSPYGVVPKIEKHIMTVSANNKNLVLSKIGDINLNYVLNSTGTKLTQGNNGITIGAGVTKVKVSCNFWVNAEGQNRVWIKLNHKPAGIGKVIGEVISTDISTLVTGSISPVLVNVSQGDYFYLSYENEVTGMSINKASGNYHATTLTVEVVE